MGKAGFIDIDQAKEMVRSAMNTVNNLRDGACWKIGGNDLLALGQDLDLGLDLETLSRNIYAENVHLAGDVDTQTLATQRSWPSTAVLLRQTLLISPAEEFGRVNTARAILPQASIDRAGRSNRSCPPRPPPSIPQPWDLNT